MRILKFAIGFLLFFCCGGNPAYPTLPKKILLIDTSALSSPQKNIIKEATNSWERQTRGCVQFVDAVDDKATKILRLTPPEKYDGDNRWTLGMCLPAVGNCKTIEISFSRMADRDQAILVAAHELGHAIGLDHNEGEHSLMVPNIYNAWIRLSLQDKIALLQATGCDLFPPVDKK